MGTANRGVSALGASLVKLAEDTQPGSEVYMLLGTGMTEDVIILAGYKRMRVRVI
jgi:hypothetical protein